MAMAMSMAPLGTEMEFENSHITSSVKDVESKFDTESNRQFQISLSLSSLAAQHPHPCIKYSPLSSSMAIITKQQVGCCLLVAYWLGDVCRLSDQ